MRVRDGLSAMFRCLRLGEFGYGFGQRVDEVFGDGS